MITLLAEHLRRLSPTYRASLLAARIERQRRIGYARVVMRRLMSRYTHLENYWGDVPRWNSSQPVPWAVRSALVRW